MIHLRRSPPGERATTPAPMSLLNDRTRRRLAPLLLVLAVVGAGYVVAPHAPRERSVELRLDEPSTITAVEVAWARASAVDEAVHGGSWRFAPGHAPATLGTHVKLPSGRYLLDVTIERGTERAAVQRAIDLADSDRVSVRLR